MWTFLLCCRGIANFNYSRSWMNRHLKKTPVEQNEASLRRQREWIESDVSWRKRQQWKSWLISAGKAKEENPLIESKTVIMVMTLQVCDLKDGWAISRFKANGRKFLNLRFVQNDGKFTTAEVFVSNSFLIAIERTNFPTFPDPKKHENLKSPTFHFAFFVRLKLLLWLVIVSTLIVNLKCGITIYGSIRAPQEFAARQTLNKLDILVNDRKIVKLVVFSTDLESWQASKRSAPNNEIRLTWTAQLRKQLFWPGPFRSPFVSVSWWFWFGEVKKFIGKFFISGRDMFGARWGGNVEPTVMVSC